MHLFAGLLIGELDVDAAWRPEAEDGLPSAQSSFKGAVCVVLVKLVCGSKSKGKQGGCHGRC